MSSSNMDAADLTDQAILDYLRKLAREDLEMPEEKVGRIQPEMSLVEGLQLDSLAQAVLIAEVEEHYEFIFQPDDRQQLLAAKTVSDLVRIIAACAKSRRA